MQNINYSWLILFVIWNIIVFLAYGADKWNAQQGKWRIPNKTLLGSAFVFGGVGALLGMYIFRHKTKTNQFVLMVPLGAVISIVMAYYLILQ